MKKNEPIFGRCEHSELTELLCLGIPMEPDEREKAYAHLRECTDCQKQFSEYQYLYASIDQVVERPVSNKVLDLAKNLKAKDTVYGLVVCEPLEKDNKGNRPFKTQVVFTANGKPNPKNLTLGDFDFGSLSEDSIAIRAMTDKKTNNLLLYLWSPASDNFDGWEIDIPQAGKTTFNPSGMSKIPLCDIEELGNKIVYFNDLQTKKASANRFARIMNAIFPN